MKNIKLTLTEVDYKDNIIEGKDPFYIILENSEKLKEQIHEAFFTRPGSGIGVYYFDNIDYVTISDIYHGEELVRFRILSREATDEPICLKRTPVKRSVSEEDGK